MGDLIPINGRKPKAFSHLLQDVNDKLDRRFCQKQIGSCHCYHCRESNNRTLKVCLAVLVFLVVIAVTVIEFGLV